MKKMHCIQGKEKTSAENQRDFSRLKIKGCADIMNAEYKEDKGAVDMMVSWPELLDEDTVNRARRLSVSLLADGAKAAGIALAGGGCMQACIQPVNRALTMAGTAITVKTVPGDNRSIHLAMYAAKQPGYVLVIDGCAHDGCAYMGDLMLGACRALGFEGVVIDGRIRDWDGVMKLDYPVYSRGFMPLAPSKEKEGEINVPVVCAGAQVRPDDLVMGDCDGVCVIPAEHVHAVLDAAEKRQAYEAAREAAIAAFLQAKAEGKSLPDLTPAWVRDVYESAAGAV